MALPIETADRNTAASPDFESTLSSGRYIRADFALVRPETTFATFVYIEPYRVPDRDDFTTGGIILSAWATDFPG